MSRVITFHNLLHSSAQTPEQRNISTTSGRSLSHVHICTYMYMYMYMYVCICICTSLSYGELHTYPNAQKRKKALTKTLLRRVPWCVCVLLCLFPLPRTRLSLLDPLTCVSVRVCMRYMPGRIAVSGFSLCFLCWPVCLPVYLSSCRFPFFFFQNPFFDHSESHVCTAATHIPLHVCTRMTMPM